MKNFTTIMLLLISIMMIGCASSTFVRLGKEPGTAVLPDGTELNNPVYYDFYDVLIPSELKADKDKCITFKTERENTVGVLHFYGKVTPSSVTKFFEVNMVRDGWRLIGHYYQPSTMLVFKKDKRECFVDVREETFYTYIEIWIIRR